MDIKAALINLQSLFSCTRKCNTKASLLLAARILGIVGLLLVSPPMAHPQQVYTDEDLKNYKAAPMADDADMKRTDKMNRANADISRSERIQELVRENMQVVSDERMNRREKCNRLRSNQRQIDELSHGETNGDSLAANARAKVYIEEYCRRY